MKTIADVAHVGVLVNLTYGGIVITSPLIHGVLCGDFRLIQGINDIYPEVTGNNVAIPTIKAQRIYNKLKLDVLYTYFLGIHHGEYLAAKLLKQESIQPCEQ